MPRPRTSDTVRSATLLAGVQARLGRQRWKLDTRVSQNDYQRNSDLRNCPTARRPSWDWASGSRLSGQVLLGSQRSLAPFNPGNAPVTNQKNIERSDRARVYARYGLAGLWAVDGSVGANRRDYSLALYDRYDYSQRNADIGLRYQPSPPLGLRLASRHSRGSYPRHTVTGVGSFQADRFSRRDLDASLTWTPGPEHQVALRISDGRSRHTEAAARDYRGRSGQLSTTWAPTSKLLFQAQLSRDTGDDSRLVDQGQFGSINSSNSRSYDSLQLQAVYSLTAKVTLDASLTHILLTGATGYIASHTWLALQAAGFDVVGVDDFSNSSPGVLDRLQRAGRARSRCSSAPASATRLRWRRCSSATASTPWCTSRR
jgi:hypothetical protein